MTSGGKEKIAFEAVLKSESGRSMFERDAAITGDTIDKLKPPAGLPVIAARALQKLKFDVQHIGTFSISGVVDRSRWEAVFSTKVGLRKEHFSQRHPELGELKYWSHLPKTDFEIPKELKGLIERAYPQRPPMFYESPLPPRVAYHHLRVPSDVALALCATPVHKKGITGRGVLVAMPDTGFYKHPFYKWHGYNYHSTLAPDATDLHRDEFGHGTAEAANVFAVAPDIDFVGVKMGLNPVLAFKAASDLYPAVMTNSWGYDIDVNELPNFLKPLEAAVIEAVRERGIIVCFSAGNGQWGFPAQMPDVIAVGGAYAHEVLDERDFRIEASNYSSSFKSKIYPGRHVPDVCGLVGKKPGGVYIMLPVEPNDAIDRMLSKSGKFPDGDETKPNDGWAVISGTSASAPQVAGVCALLKQIQPGLSPQLAKAILRASARDVMKGRSQYDRAAGGFDGATGAGLVDATRAYEMARSVVVRQANTIPPPR